MLAAEREAVDAAEAEGLGAAQLLGHQGVIFHLALGQLVVHVAAPQPQPAVGRAAARHVHASGNAGHLQR